MRLGGRVFILAFLIIFMIHVGVLTRVEPKRLFLKDVDDSRHGLTIKLVERAPIEKLVCMLGKKVKFHINESDKVDFVEEIKNP